MHCHLEYQKSCSTTHVILSKSQRFYQHWIKYSDLAMSLYSLFTERHTPVLSSSCTKRHRAVVCSRGATSWNVRSSVKKEKHSGFRVHSEPDSVSEAHFYVAWDSSFHSLFLLVIYLVPFFVWVSVIKMPGSPVHREAFFCPLASLPASLFLCFFKGVIEIELYISSSCIT